MHHKDAFRLNCRSANGIKLASVARFYLLFFSNAKIISNLLSVFAAFDIINGDMTRKAISVSQAFGLFLKTLRQINGPNGLRELRRRARFQLTEINHSATQLGCMIHIEDKRWHRQLNRQL